VFNGAALRPLLNTFEHDKNHNCACPASVSMLLQIQKAYQ